MSKKSTGMYDVRGKSIKIGDTIVYPGRTGSLMWLNTAKVIGTNTKRTPYGDNTPALMVQTSWGSNTWVYALERVAVVN